MGVQEDFTTVASSVKDVGGLNRTPDTLSYITELMGELSTIASISGLNNLSDDIQTILSKHAIGSV